MPYIEPTREAGRDLLARELQGPVVMLNLLRYREQADYSATPELAPDQPISGERAYELYAAHTIPLLEACGGKVLFVGDGGAQLIGPADERWDLVLLVQHADMATFMRFAVDPAYLAIAGHRTAALADSRLLPLVQRP